jgi:hypothetical protein
MLNNFLTGSRSFYEMVWRNMVQADRRMRFECWANKSYTRNMKYLLLFHCNMFARTHLRITFILKSPVLLYLEYACVPSARSIVS